MAGHVRADQLHWQGNQPAAFGGAGLALCCSGVVHMSMRSLHSSKSALAAFFAAFSLAAVCLSVAPRPAAAQVASAELASADSSAPEPSEALGSADIVRALRKGGYVVYFRHTSTDMSQNDSAMKGYEDCGNQRLLNAKGRDEARTIGRRVAALKLPTGEVLASPMCRTLETARLMFGSVKPQNDLREGTSGDYPGLKKMLAAPVAFGGNRWIVGHGIPFRAVAGAPHLAEGEAAVMLPEGTRWRVVARVLPDEWAGLK